MRIITGTAKGHILKNIKGNKTRPTLDRVREAVFSVLGHRVADSIFLDLFAGTGAVGIEALSRGAKICYFIEKDKKMCGLIKDNLDRCRLRDKAKIYNMDALKLIPFLQQQEPDLRFDLVYLDPPYEEDLYEPVLRLLEKSVLLHTKTILAAETDYRKVLPDKFGTMELCKQNRYGDTKIWYYKHILE